jgi:ribosomal protein L11 methylase PrmA
MTDDIYFDQTFNFTKTRFLKSGINPYNFFKNKIVLDAGCGSGKFSSAIAKFKAKRFLA